MFVYCAHFHIHIQSFNFIRWACFLLILFHCVGVFFSDNTIIIPGLGRGFFIRKCPKHFWDMHASVVIAFSFCNVRKVLLHIMVQWYTHCLYSTQWFLAFGQSVMWSIWQLAMPDLFPYMWRTRSRLGLFHTSSLTLSRSMTGTVVCTISSFSSLSADAIIWHPSLFCHSIAPFTF